MIINGNKEFDILTLQSGKYFLNEKLIFTNKAFSELKNYTLKEIKNDTKYPIYIMVGHTKGGKYGITSRIDDLKRLNDLLTEIEKGF